jgi:hypothetical protein
MSLIKIMKCDCSCGWHVELDERMKLPRWFSGLYRRYWRLRSIVPIDLSRNVRW